MNPHKEFVIRMIVTVGAFVLGHYQAVMGAIATLLLISIYALKLRKEWRHRDD